MRYYDHTTKVDNSIHFPDTIKIEEKRAATADSARLLNELSEEAKKNLIASVTINDNSLNCVAMFFQNNISPSFDFNLNCYLRFKLNGKEYTVKNELKRFSLVNPSHEEILKHIYETISKNIALELMKECQKQGCLDQLNHIAFYGH